MSLATALCPWCPGWNIVSHCSRAPGYSTAHSVVHSVGAGFAFPCKRLGVIACHAQRVLSVTACDCGAKGVSLTHLFSTLRLH